MRRTDFESDAGRGRGRNLPVPGRMSVEICTPVEAEPERVTIGTLSAMFSGYLAPRDAARLGLLEPDERTISLLSSWPAGPAPWSMDWF